MPKTANARIKHAVANDTVWAAANPVLLKGEIGIEAAVSASKFYAKVGDGERGFSSLPYLTNPVLEQTAIDLQTQIDNINGVPVVQITREDGGVIYLKETNLNVEHIFVGDTQPTGKFVMWIKPQEE